MPASLAGGAPSLPELLLDLHFDPAPVIATAAAAGAYLVGVLCARRDRGSPWPARRTAAFAAGLVLVFGSLQSGLDTYATSLLSVHMAQHLVLTTIAAALLVAGAPISLALRTLRGPARAELVRLLRGRAVRLLTRPVVAWLLFAGVLVGTHVPAVYELALRERWAHDLEHLLYLWSALLFWSPLIAADPVPHRLSAVGGLVYALTAMAPMSLVGVALASSDEVVYRYYLEPAHELGVGALSDQHLAGAVMWVGGTMLLIALTLIAAWRALAREERAARAREAREERRSATALGEAAR